MRARFLLPLALSLVLGGLVLGGCGDEATKTPSIVSIGAVSSDLTVGTLLDPHGRVMTPWAIQGVYGDTCLIHAGEAWQLVLNDPSDRSVEVVLDDTFANCPLTLTGMTMIADGTEFFGVDVAPPIALDLGFAASPSAVNMNMSFAFYTNALIEDLVHATYTNDFTIRMVYSDDVAVCGNIAPPAIYATVTATAEGAPVPTPDYTMGFDALQLVVNANLVVQSASSGDVVLLANLTPGEEYKIFEQVVNCCGPYTFASIDNHYLHGMYIDAGVITSPGDVVIPWDTFGLEGETLPAIRNVVVKHTGEGGVYSYQLFQVLFVGPS